MDPRRSARVREHVSGVLHAYTLDCELAAPIRKKIFFPTRFAHSASDGGAWLYVAAVQLAPRESSRYSSKKGPMGPTMPVCRWWQLGAWAAGYFLQRARGSQ